MGEVVFNTAMTGYQEILTDPSYCRQIVTLTYPHIGNAGVNPEDVESAAVCAGGLVIRDLPLLRQQLAPQRRPVAIICAANNVVAIAGIDTRKLTRILREKGAQNGCIMAGRAMDARRRCDAGARVSRPGGHGSGQGGELRTSPTSGTKASGSWERATAARTAATFHVVAYDFGVKRNILRMLAERGCRVTVVPAQTTAAGGAGAEAGRRVPVQRPGRSRALRLRDRGDPEFLDSRRAGVRHLPRPSVAGAGQRRADGEDEVRPSRRQPSGAGSARPGA